jgi:quercetin dioxygenase-like cupin family protein
MRVIRALETPSGANSEAVSAIFLNRTVVSCGVAEFAPGCCAHEGERHVHDHDEVFVILHGEITVPIAGGPTDVARAGDWVLVEAGEEHHLSNHATVPCKAMFLILKKPG